MKNLLLATALAITAPATFAQTNTMRGDVITAETVVDVAEITRIADAIDSAVDAKDWALARSYFTDEIKVDFSSLVGGEPATIPADGLIAGWSGNLTAEKKSFHIRGNHRVSFDGADSATMLSHGYAWNRMERGALEKNGGNPLWEVWGTYELRFIRTEDGWKVNFMAFYANAERGSEFVRNTPGSVTGRTGDITMATINLQNTPEQAGVISEPVSFDSNGVTLKGTLYKPEGTKGDLPGVIVTGAWTTVKEQMSGTYARELAAHGFAALAFDFTGWGESGGTPRYVEDPAVKTADIKAATDYMASRDNVAGLSGLGICASSGYMAEVVADDARLNKLALVAPWLHDPAMAKGIYGGVEVAQGLIASSEVDDGAVLTAASTTDNTAPMFGAPYYTEEDRGLIPAYDNKFAVATWKPWLTYDAQASADRLDKPMLMVGSPSIALPAGAEAYEARTKAPLEKIWLGEDVTQFDFYDRLDVVKVSAKAVADFLRPEH